MVPVFAFGFDTVLKLRHNYWGEVYRRPLSAIPEISCEYIIILK